MARGRWRSCLGWSALTLGCVAVAAVLLVRFVPWASDEAASPVSPRVPQVVREIMVPSRKASQRELTGEPAAVPPNAVLVDRQLINGYEVSVWEPPDGVFWVCGHFVAKITAPSGESSVIDFVSRIDPISGTDITGDAVPDLVIEHYSGGASCCISYTIQGLGASVENIPLPLSSPTRATFQDLDSDGVFEVIGTDGCFRCALCSCADSPNPLVVLKHVEGQGYVPASPEFPEIYDAVIPEYRARAESCQGEPFEEEGPTGRCCILPLALAYLYSGRAAEAWATLEQYSPSASEARALRGEIERIVAGSRLFVPREDWSDLLATREKTFSVQVDLNGDGADETVVGVEALGADKAAEFTDPGDVFVCSSVSKAGELDVLFACRTAVPPDVLPGFFEAQLVCVEDLDQDGLNEAAIVWLEQFWWPVAYRPLTMLQFDPVSGAYEMVIDVHRSVCEVGDYATADVDGDGRVEFLEIAPIYGSNINPEDGVEEFECHFCPHRYRVQAFEFTGAGFVADPCVNGGQPFVTEAKYEPYLGEGPVSTFLPELVELARGFARMPSTTPAGALNP